ncbi:MAG: hypothetical protein DHS20C21_11370 [Gemmatimonadota bacterium]|nr:MAG: hypothetical protein DHS20C21_11370 [Gemmatimonadota bacterium]
MRANPLVSAFGVTLGATMLAALAATPALADPTLPMPMDSVRGTGTGWSTASGYVVTNHHLIADRDEIFVVDSEGYVFQAAVAARDSANDVAVLEVDDSKHLPAGLPIRPDALRLGAGVFTLGFPRLDVMGSNPKLSHGIVSGLTGIFDNPNGFLVSVPIQPGNSGGPLLDMSGQVVGMVTSMVAAPTGSAGEVLPLPSVNCAVRAGAVSALLDTLPDRSTSRATQAGNADLESLVDRVQASVLIVMTR